jgi:hypothetical protein
MKETKALIKEDSSMLDDFTSDEVKELVKLTKTSKKVKRTGVRASNKAAAADTKATLEALAREVDHSVLVKSLRVTHLADVGFGRAHGDGGLCHVFSGTPPRPPGYIPDGVPWGFSVFLRYPSKGRHRRGFPFRAVVC